MKAIKIIELKNLAPYLPYGLKGICTEEFTGIETVYGISYYKDSSDIYLITSFDDLDIEYFKPILRPLSDLTKEINYGLSTYAFTYLFEIGDCDGCVFEFEHGNIKTIKALENISKYNSYNDINYLPNAVVNMMYEHHFDVFGLIEKGLAIDINTLNQEK